VTAVVAAPARPPSVVALALAVLVLLLAVAVIPLSVLARQGVLANTAQLAIGVPMCAVGFLVARRQPRNPIGWLLLVVAVGVLLSLDAAPYDVLVYRLGYHLPLGPVAVLLTGAYIPVLFVALPPVLLLFPDGTIPSRRWRWVLRCYLTLGGAGSAAAYAGVIEIMATSGIRIDASGNLAALDHPSGATAWLSSIDLVTLVLAAFWLVFVVRLALSWRRADGDRRQQLKWLLTGCAAAAAGFLISEVPALDPAGTAVGVGIVLPTCLGVAILRYRLYDIDRIISRTLAYTIVTALLAGLYAGLVLLATQVLGLTSQVAVAAATLAAAALFNPLRRRVQHRVDRRFNRARYDADNTVAAFAARLQDATDSDAVRSDLIGTVHHALEPAQVSLWLTGSPP
jgi:hypothetical protein